MMQSWQWLVDSVLPDDVLNELGLVVLKMAKPESQKFSL
jgi:hypothetical protein